MSVLKMSMSERRYFFWATGLYHSRVDYDNDDHTFEQMSHEEYFGPLYHLLKPGDYIFITDRDRRLFEVMVDEVDEDEKLVRFSLLRERVFAPVARKEDRGHAVRFKGPHHKWCILGKDGEYVQKGHASRDKAERALELLLSKESA